MNIPKKTTEPENIHHEMAQLTHQMDQLELCENERLAKELQAIELNIQEKEHRMEKVNKKKSNIK